MSDSRNSQIRILERVYEACRSPAYLFWGKHSIEWDDTQLLRTCLVRLQHGDPSGWRDFIGHITGRKEKCYAFTKLFEDLEWATYSIRNGGTVWTLFERTPENDDEWWRLEPYPVIDDETKQELEAFLNTRFETMDESPKSQKLGTIMYIEQKPGLSGHARIGRVTFSATRKTIYYDGRKLRSLKGFGYKANFHNVDSGLKYWISNCKKNGNDTLYPGIVEIDEDARIEYWTEIRNMPENVHLTKFRSEGKYAKRRPR